MKSRNVLVIAALLTAAHVPHASAADVIKIGSSLGLTGYGSLTDGHWRDGLELAIAAVNAKGGVLGQKLELVYEDNKSTPQEAVVVYRKMMLEDKVVAFDSGCISAGNFAAASFVIKAKLPMFLCSILPRLPDEQKWAFSFLPPPKFEVPVYSRVSPFWSTFQANVPSSWTVSEIFVSGFGWAVQVPEIVAPSGW